GDRVIQGGDGDWRLGDNSYWTEDTGALNAAYSNAAFAIFAGAAGTVTVDNSNGQIEAEGLQFAVEGYEIDGQPLTLIGPESIVRVGDGTADGAGYTATMASVLQGDSKLVKTDLGTLVLAA